MKILGIFFFVFQNILSETKVECVLRKLFSSVVLTDDLKRSFQDFYDEQDFSQKLNVEEEKVYKLLNLMDLNTEIVLEDMISKFDILSNKMQKAILSCNLNNKKIFDKCNKKYNTDGCFMLSQFSCAKNCPDQFFAIQQSICVEKCPNGYEIFDQEPQLCGKALESDYSRKFKDVFKTDKVRYRSTFFYKCPRGFRRVEPDICIRTCPFAWQDLGRFCRKPLIIQRGHDVFSYRFAFDRDEEVVAQLIRLLILKKQFQCAFQVKDFLKYIQFLNKYYSKFQNFSEQ